MDVSTFLDLPSVLSGDQIHFCDPYKEHFSTGETERSGYRFKLGQTGQNDIDKWPQQFEPFIDHFGCSKNDLQTGTFTGTMFRFPLREHKGDRNRKETLSETIYDMEKVNLLFESFAADAHSTLIFLKNIEKIELSFKRKGQEKEETYMCIQISDSCLNTLRSMKQHFQEIVKDGQWLQEHESICYELEIQTVLYESTMTRTMDYHYLICELFGGGESNSNLGQLSLELGSRPIVGVAMPLTMGMTHNDPGLNKPNGQIFCFLPLPAEEKSPSGLPIHVNGLFSISQNRRHLKWPSGGQDISKDRSLMWNHGLLTELIPQAYHNLVQWAIHLVQNSIGKYQLKPFHIMHMLPDIDHVDDKCQIILQPFYEELLKTKIMYTRTVIGVTATTTIKEQWIYVNEAVLEDVQCNQNTRKVVGKLLIEGGVKIVELPCHVRSAVRRYASASPAIVTPGLVRKVFQKQPDLCDNMLTCDKLVILEYLLTDHNFADLIDIPLLPLANGKCSIFMKANTGKAIYEISEPHPECLLKGLENRLMDNKLNENLHKLLMKVVESGKLLLSLTGNSNNSYLCSDIDRLLYVYYHFMFHLHKCNIADYNLLLYHKTTICY